MTKKPLNWLIAFIVIFIIMFSYFRFDSKPPLFNENKPSSLFLNSSSITNKQTQTENTQQYEVLKVIDGDTIRVRIEDQNVKIRLLQIDTPEITDSSIPMGTVASEFTENFLEGKKVSLEYDKEKTDQYGRLLCYVFITDKNGNQRCLNEELVRNGLAQVVRYGQNTLHYDDYKKIEKEAKEQNLGIWQDIKANYPPKHK